MSSNLSPTLSVTGIGSGLDVDSIVPALVEAETYAQETQLTVQETSLTIEVSSYGLIADSLDALRLTALAIDREQEWQTPTVTSSDTKYVTATATSDASITQHSISISQLAAQQSNSTTNTSFTSKTSVVGGGTLTIDTGTYSSGDTVFTSSGSPVDITIAANSTLEGVVNAINASTAGVTASILTDASNAYIVLQSKLPGAANAFKITTVDDDSDNTNNSGLSSLAYDPTAGTPVTNAARSQAAQNSTAVIDGATLSNPSNSITSVPGLTINLEKVTVSTETLTVEYDADDLKGKIVSFIDAMNDTLALIEEQTFFDQTTGESGPLFGNNTIRRLERELKAKLLQNVPNLTVNSTYTTISDFLDTNADGTYTLNETKLDSALSDATLFLEVQNLFARTAHTDSATTRVDVASVSIEAGSYAIDLTTYTAGVEITGTMGGLTATSADGYLFEGSGVLAGLGVTILGGSMGNRGNAIISNGGAFSIGELVKAYTNGVDGIITKTVENQNEQLADITVKLDELEDDKADIEARYLKQFSELNVIIANFDQQRDFLTNFFEGLNNSNS